VGFDVLTTCQPSTVWCSRERLPGAAAQPVKVHQSCSASDYYYYYYYYHYYYYYYYYVAENANNPVNVRHLNLCLF
jgi:hypothetical protein